MADIIIYDSRGNVLSTIDFSGLPAMTDVDKADSVLVYDASLAVNKKATVEELFEGGINTATTETTIADGDYIPIYDVSASALRKMTKSNFVSGAGVPSGTVIQTNSATPPSGYTYVGPVNIIATPVDTLDANVVLRISGDGSFADDKGKLVTPSSAGVMVDTGRFKLGSGSIRFFTPDSGRYLQLADSADFDFGSGDFCIDMWVYLLGYGTGADQCYWYAQRTSNVVTSILFGHTSSGKLVNYVSSNGSSWDVFSQQEGTNVMSLNAWHHVAFSRNGNTWKMFLDGAQEWTSTSSATIYNSSNALRFGGDGSSPCINGNKDNIRVTKGNARYTAAFTPEVPVTLYYHLKT